MARVRQRRLYWDAPADTDVVGYAVYHGLPAMGTDFLAQVDEGTVDPTVEVTDPEWIIIGIPEGEYQFAVCAKDDAGNFSDPYQHPAWVSVPLDVTPPGSPTGGGID